MEDHTYILWIATFAYALHVIEEYAFDWEGWAKTALNLPVSVGHFVVVNGAVMVLGICCGAVGWDCPTFSLSLPALMLINATFFHVLPFVKMKGRFSPGLGTAVVLFYPIAIWAYWGAWQDGITPGEILGSLVIGAALMAFPVIALKLRLLPYFNQR